MNEKLNDLFYKEKLGVASQATFINQVKNRYPDIKLKDVKEFLKNQEINQITTDNKKTYNYKITAPPRTFQIDIFWFRRGETLQPILLLVDILSRKAFFYMLSKKTQENILDALKLFKSEVGEINGLEGDNEFSKTDIKQFCNDNNIRLDTSVSKEEHITKGNKLGIIDRLVRTLRELIERYFNFVGNKKDSLKEVIYNIIETYNNNIHRSLNKMTPNEAFKNEKFQAVQQLNNSAINQNIYKSIDFNNGDNVRILQDKSIFDKGKNKFSNDVFKVEGRKGYKIITSDGIYKPNELLKVNKVENPISKQIIERNEKANQQAKITNKLIVNEDMTKKEALQAKKKLKENVLSPAYNTRSNDRNLRERKVINYKV